MYRPPQGKNDTVVALLERDESETWHDSNSCKKKKKWKQGTLQTQISDLFCYLFLEYSFIAIILISPMQTANPRVCLIAFFLVHIRNVTAIKQVWKNSETEQCNKWLWRRPCEIHFVPLVVTYSQLTFCDEHFNVFSNPLISPIALLFCSRTLLIIASLSGKAHSFVKESLPHSSFCW